MKNYKEHWNTIVTSENAKNEVFLHLKSFLSQSDDCDKLLSRIMENFISVKIQDDSLFLSFKNQYDSTYEIECSSPFLNEPIDNLPASYKRAIQVHNTISFESNGGGYIAYNGLYEDENNNIHLDNGSFDFYVLEEGDNSDFIDGLNDLEIDLSEIKSPIEYGQNWIIWNPLQKNKNGEFQLSFVSHELCEIEPINNSSELKFGPFFLRVMYKAIIDFKSDVLDGVYS